MQILYFSLTGTTKKAANKISDLTGATLTEIEVKRVYPKDDLSKMKDVALEEQKDKISPEIVSNIDVKKDDLIFIGCPVWNQQLPMVISEIFDKVNFEGKKIIGFFTSGSTKYTEIESDFKRVVKSGQILDGFMANDNEEILNHLKKLELIK
ncbi:flavodoxin [Pediococcus claussenii]|uniref:Flavodoxin family protein n=1 Tax=Pediococcus claussenii (strain ATCC BAA-344 / DSM 14800 / JCM 18046 / KCTC 3811 / LMG 21948 / P06) TaxID=701521 RepID=G8PBN7_PEDCP|nr:flavodoxin [Pediococcus claussenii]AEV94786.1 flavodoxin family protein [Pediococcus claussenii ATCC BAA-344]ANZ69982.1 hypothetical protein AYR57_06495 [Pediococcus claussenii]ANZ71798.1 hypothetical protein AYR58_06495 [Pediococcus claussenii]KRN20965.1 hypothetical protein IV79_GL000190 [Pediococcus claussenii]